MPEQRRGAGVLFYDARERRVLLYRRDNTPAIPFPDHIDIPGGAVEAGETPEQTVVREIAEELDDLRRGAPFVLAGHRLFMVYTDERGPSTTSSARRRISISPICASRKARRSTG